MKWLVAGKISCIYCCNSEAEAAAGEGALLSDHCEVETVERIIHDG